MGALALMRPSPDLAGILGADDVILVVLGAMAAASDRDPEDDSETPRGARDAPPANRNAARGERPRNARGSPIGGALGGPWYAFRRF